MDEYCHKLFEVSTFCLHTCAKTSMPLVNCIVNDGLMNAMQEMLLQFTTLVYIKSSAIYKEYLTRI